VSWAETTAEQDTGSSGVTLAPLCVAGSGFEDSSGSPLAGTIFGGKGE
jgi:hypothetical protein